jgi:hypothetical protein
MRSQVFGTSADPDNSGRVSLTHPKTVGQSAAMHDATEGERIARMRCAPECNRIESGCRNPRRVVQPL